MDRSMRSRTSSTSSVRSPAAPSTPAPTPSLAIGTSVRTRERGPSPDQLAASLSRLRAERALATPGAPATTPSPATPHPGHHLHPEAILDSLSHLHGGDEGIASASLPSTPAPTPFSPSPSVTQHVTSDQIAASIQKLREEGVGSMTSTQPTTPSTTPAYPPNIGLPLAGGPNLGVIPEHLAEGMNNIFRGGAGGSPSRGGADSGGADSGSAPCTPTPTPFSPSPAQVDFTFPKSLHLQRNSSLDEFREKSLSVEMLQHSILAEQLAAGISRLKVVVEEGMSSGGSTGMPATPAPTPFSIGPSGIKPEDLVAGISRLSVIQEQDTATIAREQQNTSIDPNIAIAVHEASGSHSVNSSLLNTSRDVGNSSSLSNYFGTPQSSGDSVFDTLATPSAAGRPRSREGSANEMVGGFQDVTIGTPAHKASISKREEGGPPLSYSPSPATGQPPPTIFTPNQAPHQKGKLDTKGSSPRNASPLPDRPESPARKSPTGEEAILEAWIPSPSTREALAAMAATPGTYYPTRDQLTSPGVMPGSEQGDPVREAVAKYQGEGEAAKRQILTSDGVTADIRGLQQLVAAGNYRAAVNHTSSLLELYGQGCGRAGHISKHSPSSLQVWWLRLALLVKLRHFSVAEAEAAAFGDCDKPDLYYEYYPEQYPNRRGSLVPWPMRLLLAELPGHCGRQVEGMNKLFRLLTTVRMMLSNLTNGLLPDGQPDLQGRVGDKEGALECWKERERQILTSLVNCSVVHQDYESAVKCLDMLREVIEASKREELLASLHSAYGRLYLQLGSLAKAESHFTMAAKTRAQSVQDQVENLVDSAFLAIGQGQFQPALERFLAAEAMVEDRQSKQAMAISNNISVCLLYVGRLKEGLSRLEGSITGNTGNIQANPMLNLCTLYELESSYAMQKKIGMLGLVSLHSSDSFTTQSLKL